MTRRRQSKSYFSTSSLIPILGLVAVMMVLYFMVKGIMVILSMIAPILVIATLVLNYRVYVEYGKWIMDSFKTKPLVGFLAAVGTFVAFPLVAGYLFVKALITRKLINVNATQDKEYTDYEEVAKEEDDEDFLDLPEVEKVTSPSGNANQGKSTNASSNEYEDLF